MPCEAYSYAYGSCSLEVHVPSTLEHGDDVLSFVQAIREVTRGVAVNDDDDDSSGRGGGDGGLLSRKAETLWYVFVQGNERALPLQVTATGNPRRRPGTSKTGLSVDLRPLTKR